MAAGLYRPAHTASSYFAFLAAPVFGFAILCWALRAPKSWTRWRSLLAALALRVLAFSDAPFAVARLSSDRYLRRADLNAFAARVHANGRITQMWEWPGEGFTHQINRTVVRRPRAELDSVRPWMQKGRPMLLADVLARDSIDPAVLEDFGRNMHRFHIIGIEVHSGHTLLRRDRDGGLLYAPSGLPPLRLLGTFAQIRHATGPWYFYRI